MHVGRDMSGDVHERQGNVLHLRSSVWFDGHAVCLRPPRLRRRRRRRCRRAAADLSHRREGRGGHLRPIGGVDLRHSLQQDASDGVRLLDPKWHLPLGVRDARPRLLAGPAAGPSAADGAALLSAPA